MNLLENNKTALFLLTFLAFCLPVTGNADEYHLVYMTDRRPVRIVEREWEVICKAESAASEQAVEGNNIYTWKRKFILIVRENQKINKTILETKVIDDKTGKEVRHGGVIVNNTFKKSPAEIESTIIRLCNRLKFPEKTTQECLDNLPDEFIND